MPTSLQNNRGFTIVELLFATIITIVGLLGLAQAMNYAVEVNIRNQQRDEMVQVAESWLAKFRAAPFSNISSSYGPQTVTSKLRGGKGHYTVQRTVSASADGNFVDAGVTVTCNYKNNVTSHEVHAMIAR